VRQLGANAHGEVLKAGRVPDCHLALRWTRLLGHRQPAVRVDLEGTIDELMAIFLWAFASDLAVAMIVTAAQRAAPPPSSAPAPR
jgi:hypothetical protein